MLRPCTECCNALHCDDSRLSQCGYFRTAITNPRVESSTGWSLHPDTRQQRSVSVREVARSQVGSAPAGGGRGWMGSCMQVAGAGIAVE